MPNKNPTVCFSGHRSFSGDDGRLLRAVEEAYKDGYRDFISGMAAGFDLAAAESVLKLRSEVDDVRLICAVPFEGQARGFSPADRERWERILQHADLVEMLAQKYSHGVFYRRNQWMVERSGRLICWYDPFATPSSGTRHTVRTALSAGLQIVNLFRPENALF